MCQGASTVNWTTLDPCLVFNESVSKSYTNFGFCEEKKTQTFQEHIDLQSQANYDDKKYSKKSLHILEDGASGVQVGDIEQMTI
jgi:hypothetical protein